MSADEVEAYRELTERLTFPMIIVTAARGPELAGCLVGFHAANSIKPPRHIVYVSKVNHTFPIAMAAEHLAVHFLAHDQLELASVFGEITEDHGTKFDKVRWKIRQGRPPVLEDPPAWFIGRVVARHDDGDHVGHVLEPVEAEVRRDWQPLTYQDAKDLDPGHPA
jgi:flavin reductase (DIM6/NTAB) family NADH-FMN oxidoreductase RutF